MFRRRGRIAGNGRLFADQRTDWGNKSVEQTGGPYGTIHHIGGRTVQRFDDRKGSCIEKARRHRCCRKKHGQTGGKHIDCTERAKDGCFYFFSKIPLEIVCYGARFQITDAKISAVEMSGDGCSFQFRCSAKRLEDGIAGAKNCTVRIKWLDENGKQVKATTAGVGMLEVGESGRGNTTLGMKASEMQSSPNHRFTVVLEGYGTAQ